MAYAGKWSEEREIQTGWMLCDGRALDAGKYPELADALGQSNGSLQLPNLGGRTIIGVGKGKVRDGAKALTERALNDFGGEEVHILTTSEMPKHSHAVTDPKHKHGNVPTEEGRLGERGGFRSITSWNKGSQDTFEAATNISIDPTGGDLPHNNMPPYWALHYIIKVSPTPPGHRPG
jgi:microcystin-dependent protein